MKENRGKDTFVINENNILTYLFMFFFCIKLDDFSKKCKIRARKGHSSGHIFGKPGSKFLGLPIFIHLKC